MSIGIKIDVEGLKRLRKAIASNPAIGRAIADAWSTIYRGFTRSRFYKFSRGGGDWPGLKASTLRSRRGSGVGAAILRDTNAMFASLQPELGGSGLMQSTPLPGLGFRAVLSSGTTYKSGTTLSDVASFHHHGAGRLPVRRILVAPDRRTIENMSEHGHRIVVKVLNK